MNFDPKALRAPLMFKGEIVLDVNTPEYVVLRGFYEKGEPTPSGMFQQFGFVGRFKITGIYVRRVSPLYTNATLKVVSIWTPEI